METRLFYTKKISKLIPWEAERLIDVKPELAYMDIAPMINITAHGDNATWVMTPEGGRPFHGYDLRAPVVWYVLPSL